MPIYEYLCNECDHQLDALQKMADEPLLECPSCGKPALKRLVSAPRFRLKGQGWYETDFKKDNQRNIAGDKEPKKAKKESGKDASKETKKETTTKPAASKDSKKSTA